MTMIQMAYLTCPPGMFFDPHTHICASCELICLPRRRTHEECSLHCPDYIAGVYVPEVPALPDTTPINYPAADSELQDLSGERMNLTTSIRVAAFILLASAMLLVILVVRQHCRGCRAIVVDIEMGEKHHPNEISTITRVQGERVTQATKHTHETTTTRTKKRPSATEDRDTISCRCAPWCCQSKEEVPSDGARAMLISEDVPNSEVEETLPKAGHSAFSGCEIESITETSLVPQQETEKWKQQEIRKSATSDDCYHVVNYSEEISLKKNMDMKIPLIVEPNNKHTGDSDSGKGSSILSTEHDEDKFIPNDTQKGRSNDFKAKNTSLEVSDIAPQQQIVVKGQEQESLGNAECTTSGDPAECSSRTVLIQQTSTETEGDDRCQQVFAEESSFGNTECMRSDNAGDRHTLLNHQTFLDAQPHRTWNATVLANRTAQQKSAVEENASQVSDFVLDLREERPESVGATASILSEDSLSLDLRTGSAAGPCDFNAPQSELTSLASESNADEVWANVMRVYDLMDGQQHRFPWVVGCLVSSDVLEVVVNLSGTTLTTDAAYDRLCDVIPQNLRQYLLFSVEADSPDPSGTCVEE